MRQGTYGTLPVTDTFSTRIGGIPLATHTSVDDVVLHHLRSRIRSSVFVNPGGLVPVVVRDQTELDSGTGNVRDLPGCSRTVEPCG